NPTSRPPPAGQPAAGRHPLRPRRPAPPAGTGRPTEAPAGTAVRFRGMGSGVDVVRWGGGRLRVGPWRGDRRTAYLAPVGDSPGPSPDAVRRTVADLANRGYEQAFTAALGPLEAQGFLLAGFEVHERLHLLVRDLDDL